MRLSFIYLGRRGAGGKISLELARELGLRHEVLAVISKSSEHLEQWQTASIGLMAVDTFQSLLQAIWSLLYPRKILQLIKEIRLFKPDILLFPMFHPWNPVIQWALQEIPSVVFVHDPRPHPDLSGWFYAHLENLSICRANTCIVMSSELREALEERCRKTISINVLPLGLLRYETHSPFPRRLVPRLLFFGRIVPYKGLEILLQAYEKIRSSKPCLSTDHCR